MSSTTRIEIDVDLPFRDLFWAMLRMSVSATRYILIFFAVCCLGYLLALLYQLLPFRSSEVAAYFADLLLPIAIGAGFVFLFIPLLAVVRTQRVLRAEGMHGHRRYVFTSDDISIESPLAKAVVKWPAYIRARESRAFFLLYSAASFANVIPKRCFASEDHPANAAVAYANASCAFRTSTGELASVKSGYAFK